MTSTVSETTFADNTESTKNTKDNRMILTASYSVPDEIYKLPDNLDLENKTIVKKYYINWRSLKIEYTTEEYYKQYSGSNEPSKDNKHIQEIESDGECRLPLDWEFPDNYELVSARSRWVEYSDDEEDEDETECLFLDENSYCQCFAGRYSVRNNLNVDFQSLS